LIIQLCQVTQEKYIFNFRKFLRLNIFRDELKENPLNIIKTQFKMAEVTGKN
jgi:hypothetical protein